MDNGPEQNPLPCFCGALVLIFPADAPANDILDAMQEKLQCTQYPDCTEIVYREIDSFHSWEVNDLLSRLFSLCDLDLIQRITNQFCGRVFLDISFHHSASYPALVFEGKNMAVIHALKADIGIDPY